MIQCKSLGSFFMMIATCSCDCWPHRWSDWSHWRPRPLPRQWCVARGTRCCAHHPPHWPASGAGNRWGSKRIWWPSSRWADYPRVLCECSPWSHTIPTLIQPPWQRRLRRQFENCHDCVSSSSDAVPLYRCRNRRRVWPDRAAESQLWKGSS